MKEQRTIVNSLDRGLSVLELLIRTERGLTLTQITKELHINKTAVHRLLSTFVSRGYLERDRENNKYKSSVQLVALASAVLRNLDLRSVARPFLRELTEKTKESAHLAILANGEAVFVDREIANTVVTVNTEVGDRVPLHCTAVGKLLSAFMPEELLDEVVRKKGLSRFTERTITSPQVLKEDLNEIRRQGYARDDEEYIVGLRCAAAPIIDYDEKLKGVIGVSGPSSRVTLERLNEMCLIVKEVGKRISSRFGKV